jgi:hypothetical protein
MALKGCRDTGKGGARSLGDLAELDIVYGVLFWLVGLFRAVLFIRKWALCFGFLRHGSRLCLHIYFH